MSCRNGSPVLSSAGFFLYYFLDANVILKSGKKMPLMAKVLPLCVDVVIKRKVDRAKVLTSFLNFTFDRDNKL